MSGYCYIVLISTLPYGKIERVIYCKTLAAAEEIKKIFSPRTNISTVDIIQDYDATTASIDPAYYETITDGNLR